MDFNVVVDLNSVLNTLFNTVFNPLFLGAGRPVTYQYFFSRREKQEKLIEVEKRRKAEKHSLVLILPLRKHVRLFIICNGLSMVVVPIFHFRPSSIGAIQENGSAGPSKRAPSPSRGNHQMTPRFAMMRQGQNLGVTAGDLDTFLKFGAAFLQQWPCIFGKFWKGKRNHVSWSRLFSFFELFSEGFSGRSASLPLRMILLEIARRARVVL